MSKPISNRMQSTLKHIILSTNSWISVIRYTIR